MPQSVRMGALCKCPFGVAPSSLMVLPVNMVSDQVLPAGTIMDKNPFVNVLPFGMCMSMANPMVAAATAAALGVLTPMPCIPNPPAPWVPPSINVAIKNLPALLSTAKLICAWGGVISILFPGQVQVEMAP